MNSFYSSQSWYRRRGPPFIPCLSCAKKFNDVDALKKHQEDSYHFIRPYGEIWTNEKLQFKYLDAFYENHALVLRDDQKISRSIVQEELRKVRRKFKQVHEDFSFYSFKIEPAGSTATNTKVYQADEYDFNITIDSPCLVVTKEIMYVEFARNKNNYNRYLPREAMFEQSYQGKRPPSGYVTVKYRNQAGCYNPNWTYQQYIMPKLVQQDLFKNIYDVISSDIKVCSVSHGPAITFVIKSPVYVTEKRSHYLKHEISVDFAAVLNIDETASRYGWPREATKKCLYREKIDLVSNTKLCLVPKNNFFWYISFSRPAKVLLRCIDSATTCRRRCHKLLKADFKRWQSNESFEGISTFIFKNHLFWFNEELPHEDREEYWSIINIGTCYIEYLEDLAQTLKSGELRNYFNVEENILENKDARVLERLSERITERVTELRSISSGFYADFMRFT